jgi:hypothetical protein
VEEEAAAEEVTVVDVAIDNDTDNQNVVSR